VRPRSDPHLALAVAHEVLERFPGAVERRFVERYADAATFDRYAALAGGADFAPAAVAARIAPEAQGVERLERGIRAIAERLVRPEVVPINIPSVGLSQTSGVVAHCLWGSLLALLGKYGLRGDGSPAGGTLRLPGQINAESEVQGLSRKYFMGRVPVEQAPEAARRMGLPEDAYEPVLRDTPRAALDYSDPTPGVRELVLCFGTQFESNMMERPRWLRKLEDSGTTLVVVDPIPDPYSLRRAALVLPSPPHPATTKLYQNGEWKLALSVPLKRAAPETRSDATILYDVMAEIDRRLLADPAVAAAHPDLARHARSGYLRRRFGAGLPRVDGEASRPHLYARILDYLGGGSGPLYCRPEHADGRPIEWAELLARGSVVYGGVGATRYRLDYDDPETVPFRDVFRRPRRFTFFVPTPDDLRIPGGIILNSGRSSLSEDPDRVRFAIGTFNSGKGTPTVDMPEENPLHVSPALAERLGLRTGQAARVTGVETGESLVLPVLVTDRVKGETVYVSFHKCRAEVEGGRYLNTLTSHTGRCPYTGQTSVKATAVTIERVAAPPAEVRTLDTTLLDPEADVPRWQGQATPLYVTDVIQDTPDTFTFRFQGDPLCRFVYWPGQFCTLVLNIDGKKVVRSYTIASTPSRPFVLEITVKRVPGGLVSNWLPDHLRPGDRVEISGPKGKFCLVPGKIPRKMLFVAGGSGVTPLMSMTRWLCDISADVDVRFFFSVRTPVDVVFRKEIELATQRYRMFTPLVVTTTRGAGDDWLGLTGRVSRRMVETIAPDLHERDVFMCGPAGFMDAIVGILREAGFDMARLHTESFGGVRTSVAEKPAPAVRAHPASRSLVVPVPAAPAATGGIVVEFARSGKRAATDGRMPLLDLAESQDVDVGYSCRAGTCGECKVRVLRGRVEMEVEDGLGADDRAAGYALTCVGRPAGDCVLDA
jgi:ferredoxin-NADP reductase